MSRMRGKDQDRISRAIQACRQAGLPVVDPDGCTCGLRGQLVVLARLDGLRVEWPYEKRCPLHTSQRRDADQPINHGRSDRPRSEAAREAWTRRKASAP